MYLTWPADEVADQLQVWASKAVELLAGKFHAPARVKSCEQASIIDLGSSKLVDLDRKTEVPWK